MCIKLCILDVLKVITYAATSQLDDLVVNLYENTCYICVNSCFSAGARIFPSLG